MKCCINGISKPKAQNSKLKMGVLSFGFWALSFEFLYACPFCKEAVSTGLAKGFYWSILLMLAVPIVVVAVIAGLIEKAGRRS